MREIHMLFLFTMPLAIFGQSGTSGDPFTALGNAHNVPSSGIYYFNVGGNSFSTYVEAGSGWILIASGSSATTESSYTYSTSLTLQSDDILPAAVYNTSSLVTGVRMTATSGPNTPLDVVSVNSTVLDNLKNNRTLSVNTNYTSWTGTGTARLQRSCSSNNSSLQTRIYHACGVNTNMHWQVGQNTDHERVNLSAASKNDLNLWVKAEPVALLPVELVSFTAAVNGKSVVIKWQTATETNNDVFHVERSANGKDWSTVTKVDGAGSTLRQQSYAETDFHPYPGLSYYRIKQTDLDGQFTYSPIKAVRTEDLDDRPFRIFPNPATEQLILEGERIGLHAFKISSSLGQDVTHSVKVISDTEHQYVLDISALPPGIYQLMTKSRVAKIYKR